MSDPFRDDDNAVQVFRDVPIDSFVTFETCETITNTGRMHHEERDMTREQIREHRAAAAAARRTGRR